MEYPFSEKIVLERQARDTSENARYTGTILERRGIDYVMANIVVITSGPQHGIRAERSFFINGMKADFPPVLIEPSSPLMTAFEYYSRFDQHLAGRLPRKLRSSRSFELPPDETAEMAKELMPKSFA